MRTGLGLLAAAVAAVLAAACAPLPGPTDERAAEPAIYAGMAASLLNACARGTATTPAETVTLVSDRSWTWATAHESVRASLWQPRSAIVLGDRPAGAGEDQSVRAVGACMDRHPLDWSIARADSDRVRRALYPYYRDVLIPCLRAHTGADPHLPTRDAFLLRGLSAFDPYRSVHVYSADTARRLQAACPPAPRSVLVPASLAESAARR